MLIDVPGRGLFVEYPRHMDTLFFPGDLAVLNLNVLNHSVRLAAHENTGFRSKPYLLKGNPPDFTGIPFLFVPVS